MAQTDTPQTLTVFPCPISVARCIFLRVLMLHYCPGSVLHLMAGECCQPYQPQTHPRWSLRIPNPPGASKPSLTPPAPNPCFAQPLFLLYFSTQHHARTTTLHLGGWQLCSSPTSCSLLGCFETLLGFVWVLANTLSPGFVSFPPSHFLLL